MNLYDKLLNKEGFMELGKSAPKSYLNLVEILNNSTYIHDFKLVDAAELYWMFYPTEVFDMTKFFHLFELAD